MPLPEKDYFTIIEIAHRWKCTISDVISHGATEKVKIHAIADNWNPANNEELINGLVELTPEDILKASSKDHVEITAIKLDGSNYIKLEKPEKVLFGAVYILCEERDRFEQQYNLNNSVSSESILESPTNQTIPKSDNSNKKEQVLTEKEAAEYINMSASFLKQSRSNGDREGHTKGPRFTKLGRAIRYRKSDLDAWLEENSQKSNSSYQN